MTRRSGQCLCGAVTFEAEIDPKIQACHCTQCQRWTGGGPLYSTRARDLTFVKDGETLSYRASHWGERVVCATCGSTLWWKRQGEMPRFVAAGLIDDQSGLSVGEEIFVDCRPDWMPPFAGATQSTEAQELAKLDAQLKGETT